MGCAHGATALQGSQTADYGFRERRSVLLVEVAFRAAWPLSPAWDVNSQEELTRKPMNSFAVFYLPCPDCRPSSNDFSRRMIEFGAPTSEYRQRPGKFSAHSPAADPNLVGWTRNRLLVPETETSTCHCLNSTVIWRILREIRSMGVSSLLMFISARQASPRVRKDAERQLVDCASVSQIATKRNHASTQAEQCHGDKCGCKAASSS